MVLDLVLVYARVARSSTVRHLFNLAREDAIATWVGSTQCLAAAGALVLVGAKRLRDGCARSERIGWTVLAIAFAYVAVDDAMELHEKIGGAFRRWSSQSPGFLASFPSYYWQLVFGPVFGALAVFLIWFLWRRFGPARLRRWLTGALACFVVAVAIDFVEGLEGAFDTLAATIGTSTYAVSHPIKVTEEALELGGTSLFLITFLRYLVFVSAGARFVVASGGEEPLGARAHPPPPSSNPP